MTIQRHQTAENTLNLLRALKNYPDEALAPYEEFEVGQKTYYFSLGGSLYRKDPELSKEEVLVTLLAGRSTDDG